MNQLFISHHSQPRSGVFTHTASKPIAVGCIALALSSCSSLRFDDRLLVKVPDRAVVQEIHRDGWNFRHLAEAPKDKKNMGNWYVAYQDSDLAQRHRPVLALFIGRWERARQLAPALADASHDAFGVYPTMIEPNLVFSRSASSKESVKLVHPEASSYGASHEGQPLLVAAKRTSAWPSPGSDDPAWHLQNAYSQLSTARSRARGGEAIRIGILDNGFSRCQSGTPERLDEDIYGDAMGWAQGTPKDGLVAPGDWGGSHGTGTIGILTGRKVRILADTNSRALLFDDYLGGAPKATVVPVRIAPWVFSVETASLAYGIDYASRIKHCDVLSLSHGGSPSQAWVDAVNAAYERGTAIFATEGDFFSLGFDPLPPDPIFVPSSPVYPAAFRRVMGVTGVTSAGSSYARNSLGRLLRNPSEFGKWIGRGSYGPDGWREHFHNEAEADPAQRRLGLLRAYPVAAYSPNIPWLVAPNKLQAPSNRVDLNGSGTSAATPQVAAAAALWLARHRNEMQRDWHSWKKSEAVYFALLASAAREKNGPDRYLGAGILKANDALSLSYRDVRGFHEKALLNFEKSGRDYFDGSRSFWTLLRGQRKNVPRFWERAGLKQEGVFSDRRAALAQLYYNVLLLEQWHTGRIPRNGTEQAALEKKGQSFADTAAAQAFRTSASTQ